MDSELVLSLSEHGFILSMKYPQRLEAINTETNVNISKLKMNQEHSLLLVQKGNYKVEIFEKVKYEQKVLQYDNKKWEVITKFTKQNISELNIFYAKYSLDLETKIKQYGKQGGDRIGYYILKGRQLYVGCDSGFTFSIGIDDFHIQYLHRKKV